MKKILIVLAMIMMLATGCNMENTSSDGQHKPFQESTSNQNSSERTQTNSEEPAPEPELTADITQLNTGLSAVKYTGDYGFEEFLTTMKNAIKDTRFR